MATLFDFNGVLVDDEDVHLSAFREVLMPLGVTVTDAAYEAKYLGFDDRGAFRAILADHAVPFDELFVGRLIAAKKPAYMQRIESELVVFEGAVELVRRRARCGLVAIVSGALRAEIEHCLDRMGIRDLVSWIVSAEDTVACKPDPEGYLLARSRLAPATRTVALEDSIAGVAAAKKAELRCVAVTHSYPEESLQRAGADLVVHALAEVDDVSLDGAAA